MITSTTPDDHQGSISRLQVQAWAIANAGYRVPDGNVYRAYARELYEEDLHERIQALFARLDAQNGQIEAELRRQRAILDAAPVITGAGGRSETRGAASGPR